MKDARTQTTKNKQYGIALVDTAGSEDTVRKVVGVSGSESLAIAVTILSDWEESNLQNDQRLEITKRSDGSA
jgi:hypothetical protein